MDTPDDDATGGPAGGTALVTDSTAYLGAREAAALGVAVVPLHVVLGDWSGPEPDLDPRELYRRLRAGGVAKTSQPSPGHFLAAFEAAAAGGADRVLAVTCAASMSGTHASAVLAAGMASVPVDVVDSGTISGGLRMVVTELSRALAGGATHSAALALASSLRGRVWSTWSSDTSALLAAGGRFTDDVPDGVPVLGLEGEMSVLGAARSVQESVRLQADHVRAAARRFATHVTVGHGDVPELADALAAALEGAPGVLGVDRYVVGPVVGSHVGPGCFGANYLVAPLPVAPPAGGPP